MKPKNRFGKWLYNQLESYQISMLNLSDYSGIHIRTLYRMTNGDVKIKNDDCIWILECLSDMTNQDFNMLVDDWANKTIKKNVVK